MSEEQFIENGKRVKILSGRRRGKRGTIVMSFSEPKIVQRWWDEPIAEPGYVIEIGTSRVCEPTHNVRLDEESSPEKRQKILEEGLRKSIKDSALVQSSETQNVNAKSSVTPPDTPPKEENKVIFPGL